MPSNSFGMKYARNARVKRRRTNPTSKSTDLKSVTATSLHSTFVLRERCS